MKKFKNFLALAFAISLMLSCTKQSATPSVIQKTQHEDPGLAVAAIVRTTKVIDLPDHDAFVGIRWNNDNDLNFNYIDSATGVRQQFLAYDGDIRFSGDIRTGLSKAGSAARELYYALNDFTPCTLRVRLISGTNEGAPVKFNVYTGQEHIDDLTASYKVNDANITYNRDFHITGNGNALNIGYISGNKLYIYTDIE